MNPDQPSREEVEAKLTALLLGELPEEEAKLLRWAIEHDAGLANLYEQLKRTIGIVREVSVKPAESDSAPSAALKLSGERRKKLLAHFKTPRPKVKELFWLKRIEMPSLITVLAALALIAVLAAMLLPATAAAKRKAQRASSSEQYQMMNERKPAPGNQNSYQQDSVDTLNTTPHALDGGGPVRRQPSTIIPPPPVVSPPVVAENRRGPDLAGGTPTEIVLPKPDSTAEEYAFEGAAGVVSRPSVLSGIVTPAITESQAPAAGSSIVGSTVPYVTSTYGNSSSYSVIASPAPAAPQAPAAPSAALSPGGVVEANWSDSGQWNLGVQSSDSSGNKILLYNGNIQNQVATADAPNLPPITGIGGVNLDRTAGVSGAGGGRGGAARAGRGGRGGGGGGRGAAGGGGFGGGGNGGGGGASAGSDYASANGPQANTYGIVRSNGNLADQAGEVLRKRVDGLGTAEQMPVEYANSSDISAALNDSGIRGRMPDNATIEAIPQSGNDKTAASTLVQDAKTLYERGKFDESKARLDQALKLDPDNQGAYYYKNLDVQADYARQKNNRTTGVQDQMVEVAKEFSPVVGTGLPVPNPNAIGGVPQSAANPLGQFPGNTAAATDSRLASDSFDSYNSAAGPQNQGEYYRSQVGGVDAEQKQALGFDWYLGNFVNGSVVANGGSEDAAEKEKLPALGDVPLEVVFATRDGSAVAAALSPAPSGATDQKLVGGLFDDSYTTGNSVEAAKELTKTGSGAVALNGENTFSGGTVVSGGTTSVTSGRTSYNGVPEQPKELPQSSALQLRFQNSPSSMAAPEAETGNLAYNNNGMVGAATISADTATKNLVVVADAQTKEQVDQITRGLRLRAPAATPPGNVYATNAVSVSGGKFYSSVTIDDVSGQNYLLATNNISRESAVAEPSTLETRAFKVDPNTLSKGLLSVSQSTFGSARSLSSSQPRSNSEAAQTLFSAIGVNLAAPGKSITYDDKSGTLVVKATPGEMDVIGKTVQILNQMAPQTKAADIPLQKAPEPPPIPQPEVQTFSNAFSTFSMNVSDVSFKLAEASLQKGRMPDAASIRSEEFINAFDYRDPEAAAGQPVAFASERARYPFAQNRDLLRFSIKTAAAGRAANRPLNLVLLLDNSGSMERADRVAIIREALRVLAAQLHPQDTVSVVTFARTARLWADGVAGDKAGETLDRVGGITPEGGTNLEEAMRLAYETARRHYLANGANRVVLLTDGAANLGNVDPGALKQKVESFRKQGIALDCFGIGWDDYNDTMLAELSGNGDGRYAFINSPEEAGTDFASKLAGALQVAAQDVKVQVEFNPQRVTSWRQIGYAKHQLTKEQFRDNSVLAAEVAAQEAGNALYTVEIKPDGIGPVATVYVRYKIPGTMEVQEHSWDVPYDGNAAALEQSSAAMRLAGTASAFSEWLAGNPFAQEVTTDELLKDLSGVPQIYGADQRPRQLEWMIRQAKSLSGK